MSPQQTMLRAAQLLESDSEDLRSSHTLADGEWDTTDPIDESAKRDCDERLAIAAKLRLMATA